MDPVASRAAVLLREAGITIAATLPDQWLGGVIDALDAEPTIRLVRVTREDDGVGICAGAYLGGQRAALVCQSAGLLLSANALAGYALHHQTPFLVLAALRGGHDDGYYYQTYKHRVITPVLDALGLPHHTLRTPDDLGIIPDAARQAWLSRRPVVLLAHRDALREAPEAGR
jgi:sulfopyruvate decarboxylase subunit alpha